MSTLIEIEDYYPHSYDGTIRYGNGKPPHKQLNLILSEKTNAYISRLADFTKLLPHLLKIPCDQDPSNPLSPYWINEWLPGIDALTLYCTIAIEKPKRYYEIGSGCSTQFAFAAKMVHNSSMEMLSVDPHPRAEIEELCSQFYRQTLQNVDLSVFEKLESGDILFFDGSHRVLQNSDVSVFFLEVLPLIQPGVVIQIHDIFLPYDYPPAWVKRAYSEQYMLASILLFAHEKFEVLLPNAFISEQKHLLAELNEIWNHPHFKGVQQDGGSFWFKKK